MAPGRCQRQEARGAAPLHSSRSRRGCSCRASRGRGRGGEGPGGPGRPRVVVEVRKPAQIGEETCPLRHQGSRGAGCLLAPGEHSLCDSRPTVLLCLLLSLHFCCAQLLLFSSGQEPRQLIGGIGPLSVEWTTFAVKLVPSLCHVCGDKALCLTTAFLCLVGPCGLWGSSFCCVLQGLPNELRDQGGRLPAPLSGMKQERLVGLPIDPWYTLGLSHLQVLRPTVTGLMTVTKGPCSSAAWEDRGNLGNLLRPELGGISASSGPGLAIAHRCFRCRGVSPAQKKAWRICGGRSKALVHPNPTLVEVGSPK